MPAYNPPVSDPPGLKLIGLPIDIAAPVAAIDITSRIDATYDEYEIHFQNLTPSASAYMAMFLSTDNGATFAGSAYNYTYNLIGPASDTTSGGSGQSEIRITDATQRISTTVADGGASGVIRLIRMASTVLHKHVSYRVEYASGGVTNHNIAGSGRWQSITAVNAVRLAPSAGNWEAGGSLKVYGVKR